MRVQVAKTCRDLLGRIRRDKSSSPLVRAVEMEGLEGRQLLSTYYVSNSGRDSASGTSSSSAWKTINRVNSQHLHSGDKILFKGGQSFSGGIYLPSSEGGVTIGTYGSGRATINSGTKSGVEIAQTAGVTISNLVLNGAGMSTNHTPGINFHVEFTGKKLSGLTIRNVEIKNYGQNGLRIITNGPGGSSISNVTVEDTSIHDNLWGGISAYSNRHNYSKNWIIRRVKAYNNIGSMSKDGVTGNGIFIADVDGAIVEHCIAYNNGKNGKAPVGIWAAGSNRVTFQYNESYNNSTHTSTDGGGFDFDWDVTNSIMQYNYSHSNAGPGYLICAATHTGSNNVIRYNVSQNDGRKNGVGGIQLYGNVTNSQIYNNTVYFSATGNSNSAAFRAHDSGISGHEPKGVQVRNNIFYATGGAKVVNLTSGVANAKGISFVGNAYHSSGGSFKIQWGGSSYSSLSAWRSAKGQEKLNGVSTGYQGDPKLVGAGKGGTVNSTSSLSSLSQYKLQSTSPLINRGQSQASFLSSVVSKDFFGGTALLGGKHDIGVDEVR